MIVSKERLEELESKCTGYLAWLAKNSDTLDEDTADFLSVLTELKSIRQAATAGVEEAANKLVRFVEAKVSEYLPGDFTLTDDDAQAVRAFLAALLAERDAVLRECQSFIGKLNDRAERFHFADADRDTMAAMLSRIDALTKGGDDGDQPSR